MLVAPCPTAGVTETVPDEFIQKGNGYGRKPVFHGKLPPYKVFVSESSLKFWASQNGLWPGLDICTGSVSTDMYQAYGNGICYAYFARTFPTMDGAIVCYATPARGIGSDFWSIGTISYAHLKENPNEGARWRYPVVERFYHVDVPDHFPWVSNLSYDPSKVEAAAISRFNPDAFSEWDQSSSPRPIAYEEFTKPDFRRKLFREDLRINGIPVSDHEYEFSWLVQHAFYDACNGIGKANENTIQNIVQIVSDIASICSTLGIGSLELVDDTAKVAKKSLKKRLKEKVPSHELVQVAEKGSSAWLGYRYSYTTTMMDYRQYVEYINHKADLYFEFMKLSYHETVFGTATLNVDGVDVRCTCQLAYRPRTYEGLKSAMRYIHDAGLEVNPYVLWDFVPYSFIVDWAVPLGDVFSVISDQKYYTSEYYDFEYVGFSIKYELGEEGTRYYRWYQDPPPLESFYWFDKGDSKPSGKLMLKRALDVVSLIVG